MTKYQAPTPALTPALKTALTTANTEAVKQIMTTANNRPAPCAPACHKPVGKK